MLGWASGSSRPPWQLADSVAEVMELGLKFNVSFVHITRSANEIANSLAKEGVRTGRLDLLVKTSVS